MKIVSALVYALVLILIYLLYTGSYGLFETVVAVGSGFLIAYVFARDLVSNLGRLGLARFFKSIYYVILYFTVVEFKAHLSVVSLILRPRARYKPAIVRVPYHLESDYSVFAVANSITNTPGTVVVDVDETNRHFYVHWINAQALEDEEVRRIISLDFEKRIREIFE